MANEFTVTDDDTLNSAALIGLMGPSSSGKTYSAHELAVGLQKVLGGHVGVIDTEAHRAKHYRRDFAPRLTNGGRLKHLALEAPFGADRYTRAIHHLVQQEKCNVLIVDSTSHSWDGPGGLLEQHEAEVERLTKGKDEADTGARERVSSLAWVKPKKVMRRMVTDISTTLRVAAIFCFRAQEKKNWGKKDPRTRQPTARGWIPIGDPALVYEFTINFLLDPNCDGMPNWAPYGEDAGKVLKRPKPFRSFLLPGRRIDATMGEMIGLWSKGEQLPSATPEQLEAAMESCLSLSELEVVGRDIGHSSHLSEDQIKALRSVYAQRKKSLTAAEPQR